MNWGGGRSSGLGSAPRLGPFVPHLDSVCFYQEHFQGQAGTDAADGALSRDEAVGVEAGGRCPWGLWEEGSEGLGTDIPDIPPDATSSSQWEGC